MLRTRRRAAHGDRPIRPHWHAMPCPTRSLQRSPWRQRQTGRGIHRGHAFLRSTTPPPACTPAASNVCPSLGLLQLVRNSVPMVSSAYPVGVDLEVELRTHGYRVTTARRVVWEVLSAAGDHLTAPSITSRVHAVDPSINGASVYRALTLFAELGPYGIPLRGCIDVGAFHDDAPSTSCARMRPGDAPQHRTRAAPAACHPSYHRLRPRRDRRARFRAL